MLYRPIDSKPAVLVLPPAQIGQDIASPRTISEWRRGWRVVLAAMFGVGTTYSLFLLSAGLFIVPMQKEFGWSRSAVALGPIVMFISGMLNPVAGALIARFGARGIAIPGVLALTLGYIALALMPVMRSYFYVVAIYLAAAGAMTNVIAYSRAVATWFHRQLGAAIGLTMSGIFAAIAVPILSVIINEQGWRMGYFALAGCALISLPFLLLWFREDSAGAAAHATAAPVIATPSVSIPAVVRNREFWILALAMNLAALSIGGFISQLAPILVSHQLSPAQVGALVSVFTISIGIGRIGAGWLLDVADRPTIVASLCIASPALGALVLTLPGFAAQHWTVTAAGVALIGLAQGAEADFTAFFLIRLFGLRVYSVLYGSLLATIALSMAAGGLIYAGAFDHFGNYQAIIYGSVMAFACASLLMLALRVPSKAGFKVC